MEAGQLLSEALISALESSESWPGARPTATGDATRADEPLRPTVSTRPGLDPRPRPTAQSPLSTPPSDAFVPSGAQAAGSPSTVPLPSNAQAVSSPGKLNVGAIVGVVGGVIGCIALGALVFYCCGWRRKRARHTIQRIEETREPQQRFEIDEVTLPPAYDPQWNAEPLSPISVAQLNEKGRLRW
ncbi:hypothetical protein CC85DRAFT_168510 [Cutaneotrichosporon oleaginosum]|uniref:Mid2 domain-containing protein n=1 Tax=Cutaneotrichosporon oleaginosum TaxID=879819 RepID=A0A0J0XV71_9TREE|nr:uncharacterized protein CC85DRAFT_168510 [Cutaneotrichosporon oleaginosum]KLT44960.1 hypothetical protein CC85DRAFT_168510 [Cutaneotrichosporon oleaginosum]TXT09649.1 hypothetical protein COLE_03583 [Cutaneotrichosporon oleaginosum]